MISLVGMYSHQLSMCLISNITIKKQTPTRWTKLSQPLNTINSHWLTQMAKFTIHILHLRLMNRPSMTKAHLNLQHRSRLGCNSLEKVGTAVGRLILTTDNLLQISAPVQHLHVFAEETITQTISRQTQMFMSKLSNLSCLMESIRTDLSSRRCEVDIRGNQAMQCCLDLVLGLMDYNQGNP